MSLREHAEDPQFVMGLVRMCPETFFVLVEGTSDYRFLANHVPDHVSIKDLAGRKEVINACRELSSSKVENYVGLADMDFRPVVGLKDEAPRVVHVSLGAERNDSCIDLEASLLRTRALRKVCVDILGSQVERFGGASKLESDLRSWLRTTTAGVGAYRAAVMESYQRRQHVKSLSAFDKDALVWKEFCDARALSFDVDRLHAVMSRHVVPVTEVDSIKQSAKDYLTNYGAGWLLCRGHDMTFLLAQFLSLSGTRTVSHPEAESKLRLAFERSMLRETAFGRELISYLPKGVEASSTVR
jgi:hypothetical protein